MGEFAHYYVEAFDAANNSSLPTNEASIGYSLHTEKRSENNQRGTLQISEAYPNPFNPSTTIKFVTPTDGKVKLTVHNLLGQEVATLTDEYKTAGQHEVVFNAEELPSGVYFYRLTTASGSITKRMVLMK